MPGSIIRHESLGKKKVLPTVTNLQLLLPQPDSSDTLGPRGQELNKHLQGQYFLQQGLCSTGTSNPTAMPAASWLCAARCTTHTHKSSAISVLPRQPRYTLGPGAPSGTAEPGEKRKTSKDVPKAAHGQSSGRDSRRAQVSRDRGVSLAGTTIPLALTHPHSLHFPTLVQGLGRGSECPVSLLTPLAQATPRPLSFAGRNQCPAFPMLAAELCHQPGGENCQVKQL